MPISIVTGFDITNNQPFDAKFVQANTGSRNALPAYKRYEGMMVYVVSNSTMYQLRGGIGNGNWITIGSVSLQTGSYFPISASWADSASNAISASWAPFISDLSAYLSSSWTGSADSQFAGTASFAISSSWAPATDTSTYLSSSWTGSKVSQFAGTASFAKSASWAPATVTSTYLSSSWTGSTNSQFAGTASFATSASWAPFISDLSAYLSSSWTGSNDSQFSGTASFATSASWSPATDISAYLSSSWTASVTAQFAGTASAAISASWAPSNDLSTYLSSSWTASVTASILGTASWAASASWAPSNDLTPYLSSSWTGSPVSHFYGTSSFADNWNSASLVRYVEASLSQTNFYLTATASSAGFYEMRNTGSGGTIGTLSSSSIENGAYPFGWITPIDVPGLAVVPAGIYQIDFNARILTASGVSTVTPEIILTTSSGSVYYAYTNGETTPTLSSSFQRYSVAVIVDTPNSMSVIDRIGVRLRATTTLPSQSYEVQVEGSALSRVKTPISNVVTNVQSASYSFYADSAGFAVTASTASYAEHARSASWAPSNDLTPYLSASWTGSNASHFSGSASYAINTATASRYILKAGDNFSGPLTAQTAASVDFSNSSFGLRFAGNVANEVQIKIASEYTLEVTNPSGSVYFSGSQISASRLKGTASMADSASYAFSGSYAHSASWAPAGGDNFSAYLSSSWTGSNTSQFSGTSSFARTASLAQTSSFVTGSQSVILTLTASIITPADKSSLVIGSGSSNLTQADIYIVGPDNMITNGRGGSVTIRGGRVLDGGSGGNILIDTGITDIGMPSSYILLSTVNTGSNVGIGTASPVNALDVVGNISCSVITSSLLKGTASFATSSSFAITSSYSVTASFAINATAPNLTAYLSSSWTGSKLSQFSGTASFATSASWAPQPLIPSVNDYLSSSWTGSNESLFSGTASFALASPAASIDLFNYLSASVFTSWVSNSFSIFSGTASYAASVETASFATSASWAPPIILVPSSSVSQTSSYMIFNGTRSITRGPYEGINLGTTDIIAFLNGFFFPFVSATISINGGTTLYETGSSQLFTISGSVTAKSETIFASGSIRKAGINWFSFASASAYSTTDTVSASQTYQTFMGVGNNGSPSLITSSTKTVSFIYPYLWGMNTTAGLTGSALYTGMSTKSITDQGSKSSAFIGSSTYIYFCYPSSYSALGSIKDPNNFEILSSFNASASVAVTSSGLPVNWKANYRVYRLTLQASPNGTYTFS